MSTDHKKGWQTDRGEVILRFGEPLNIMRIRPSMGETGYEMKTDIWNYEEMNFGFTDMALNNNFIFSAPPLEKEKVVSQYALNSHELIQYLRKSYYSKYVPVYEGDHFTMYSKDYYFKSFPYPSKTEVHIVFHIPDSIRTDVDSLNIETGFFFFDRYHNQIEKIVENKYFGTNSGLNEFVAALKPDIGFYSFELIEKSSRKTSVKRGTLSIPNYGKLLSLSSLILADTVYSAGEGILQRGPYSFNPHTNDTVIGRVYLYYEVYNLQKNDEGFVEFRQNITIKRNEGEEGLLSSIKNLFSKRKALTLTNKYRADRNDLQLFIRLDLSNLKSGNYDIEVEIEDLISKKNAKSKLQLDVIQVM